MRQAKRCVSAGWIVLSAICWVSLAEGGIPLPVRASDSLTRQVNPFIGTGGIPWASGFLFPGATTPWGMVRLSPDTARRGVSISSMHTSGYYYGDNEILGFSHTRLSGTGATEGGLFLVVPTLGPVSPRTRFLRKRARFSHGGEVAEPGYYAVFLPEEGILAELTATPHVGVHRYTFPAGREAHLLLRVTNALGDGHCEGGWARLLPQRNEIEGSARLFGTFSGRYGGLTAYFVARLDTPWSQAGVWHDRTFEAGESEVTGDDIGVDLAFERRSAARAVQLTVGLSYVSVANARANLDAEVPAQTRFDEVREGARERWERALASIVIEGGRKADRTIFYTALYHAMIMPTRFQDVTGDYLGFDQRVHRAEGFQYYTDISLWDTYRTLHPLYILIAPDVQRDIVVSMIEMARQGGWFPRWPSGAGYTNAMLSTPADIMISESYLKGIRDFDAEAAYAFMRRTADAPTPEGAAFSGREGWADCLEAHYCPADRMEEAVSRTLEFAHADDAISRFAEALGKPDDAARFRERSRWYRNVWNPETRYFQPRNADGTFATPFFPRLLTYLDPQGKYTNDYVEGSALQWRWSAQFDLEGMIGLYPSAEVFVAELEAFFANANPRRGAPYPGPYYWHGNQPDIHAAYLFNAAGRPDLTQKWVHWIMENKYGTGPDGLDGNDDGGTLSAWYVLSALGFYPIVGSDRYEIGTPRFPYARVNLGNGVFLEIVAENLTPENFRVARVTLNGVPLERRSFTHDEIAGGGLLYFEMAPGDTLLSEPPSRQTPAGLSNR